MLPKIEQTAKILKTTSKRRRTGQDIEGEEPADLGELIGFLDPGGPNLRAQVRRKRTLAAKKRASKKRKRPQSIRTRLVAKLRAAKKRAATAFRNAERDLIALKAQKTRTIFVRSDIVKVEPLEF